MGKGVEPYENNFESCMKDFYVPTERVGVGLKNAVNGNVGQGAEDLAGAFFGFALLLKECLDAAELTDYDILLNGVIHGPTGMKDVMDNALHGAGNLIKNIFHAFSAFLAGDFEEFGVERPDLFAEILAQQCLVQVRLL